MSLSKIEIITGMSKLPNLKAVLSQAQTFVQLGCEFVQNMAKFQCCTVGCFFIFYHIPEV